MIEIWKDIPEYEGLYQASNLGNIKALAREWVTGYNNVTRKHPDIILKPGKNRDGYLSVTLTKDKKSKHHSVHRLILKTFMGDSKYDCNHIDGNKENNTLENLEYCTEKENIRHAYEVGLNNNKGENHRSAKLNKDIIKNIRENKFKLTTREFATCYGITKQSVSDIINKKTWAHV